jgi:hypothetical protein
VPDETIQREIDLTDEPTTVYTVDIEIAGDG